MSTPNFTKIELRMYVIMYVVTKFSVLEIIIHTREAKIVAISEASTSI